MKAVRPLRKQLRRRTFGDKGKSRHPPSAAKVDTPHKKTVGIYHENDNPEGLYRDNNLVFATDEGKPFNPRTFAL